jgi:malate dehydrogenase (oxaloacetate-decarboxylating)(NADP+)
MADMIASAMTLEELALDQARARIGLFDVNGLIESSRTDLLDFQKPYAHAYPLSLDFVTVIESLKPTAIIGVSTKGKAFNRKVIEAMARINTRPIIFALSNPADRAECTAEEAYRWSDGRALLRPACPSHPCAMAARRSSRDKATTCTSFPPWGWRSSPLRRGG